MTQVECSLAFGLLARTGRMYCPIAHNWNDRLGAWHACWVRVRELVGTVSSACAPLSACPCTVAAVCCPFHGIVLDPMFWTPT
jgi:hypothetical protein